MDAKLYKEASGDVSFPKRLIMSIAGNPLIISNKFDQEEISKDSEKIDIGHNQIIIMDKEAIKTIAIEQSLKDFESISEIRFDDFFTEDLNASYSTLVSAVNPTYYVNNLVNNGTGYIYSNNYISHIFNGPANVSQTFSKTDNQAITGSVGVTFKKVVELKFGVTINRTDTQSTTYSFSVPANKTVELKVFTNYQKLDYEVWRDFGGLGYYYASDTLYKAVGLKFEQIIR
ncbi:MAG: hypothetical protein LBB94_11750 [Clostridiales bacterium]|jgi:hypothetical protein|nr:hypothetical protein [Clostridiales bacterium]